MRIIICTLLSVLFLIPYLHAQSTFKKTIKANNQVNDGMLSLTQDGGFITSGSVQKNDSTVITIFKLDKNISAQWAKVISNGTHLSDYGWFGYPVIQTSDGGYALTTQSQGSFIFIKLDASGNIIWTKKYMLNNGIFTSQSRLIRTNDNSVTICGALFYSGKYYQCLFQINSLNGNVIWLKSWSLNGGITPQDTQAINLTKDSGYIVGGGLGTYYTICRFDKNGIMRWNKVYAPAGNSNTINGITETLDKGYVFTGSTRSINTIGEDDLAVMKLDIDGKVLWAKQMGNSGSERGFDVVKNADSSFTLAGFRTIGSSYRAGYMVKLDKAGSLIWSKELLENQPSGVFATYTTLFKTKDKGYILGGSYAASNKRQMAVLKLDSLGNNCSGSVVGDTGIRVLPYTEKLYSVNSIDLTSLLTVSDDFFNYQKNKATVTSLCESEISKPEVLNQLSIFGKVVNDISLKIYPNPVANGFLNVDIRNLSSSNVNLSIYDLTGKNVHSEKFYFTGISTYRSINISSLSAGTYFIKIYNSTWEKNIKFIKQ